MAWSCDFTSFWPLPVFRVDCPHMGLHTLRLGWSWRAAWFLLSVENSLKFRHGPQNAGHPCLLHLHFQSCFPSQHLSLTLALNCSPHFSPWTLCPLPHEDLYPSSSLSVLARAHTSKVVTRGCWRRRSLSLMLHLRGLGPQAILHQLPQTRSLWTLPPA